MIKNVKNGDRIATITLDGTECAVKFGSTFNVFEVKNNSSAPVLMALSEGAAAGDDGVVSIPAGGSFCYPHMRNIDTVYLTGNGEAAVVAKNTTDPSFKSASAGGQSGGGNVTVINDNLLINPNFLINQRSVSGTFSETGKYFVDRWRLESGSVTINADGTLTLNGTIAQILENAVGTNVTATSDGGTASYDNSTKTFTITGNGDVIRWVKLEYGDTATAFIPPEPTQEYIKCTRFYEQIEFPINSNLLACQWENELNRIVSLLYIHDKRTVNYNVQFLDDIARFISNTGSYDVTFQVCIKFRNLLSLEGFLKQEISSPSVGWIDNFTVIIDDEIDEVIK